MLREMIQSLFLIFMAEMGDKTQILAMAFATKFKVSQVLWGVFLGVLLNHGIAVALGSYLSVFLPINIIQIIAGFSFVGFALWTLKIDQNEEEEDPQKSLGPVLTVAMAFFIGELGDKTQLTAITLAADASFPVFVLMGTVTGMILTSGVGIFVGSKLGHRVPELTIKMISACIFMFFGVTKLYTSLPQKYITPISMTLFLGLLAFTAYFILKPTLEMRKRGEMSSFRETAFALYTYMNEIRESVDTVCLGEGKCGTCQGGNCIVGYTKMIMDADKDSELPIPVEDFDQFAQSLQKDFSAESVLESLSKSIAYLMNSPIESKEHAIINRVRESLEVILFHERFDYKEDSNEYFKLLEKKDQTLAQRIRERVQVLHKEFMH